MWAKILFIIILFPFGAMAQTEPVDENTTEISADADSQEVKATEPEQASGTRNDKVETMQVTGSYIRRTDIEGPSPILVIDRQTIEQSGFNNVSDVLQRSTVSPFGGGGSTVSLKGIGSARTLVLINGQRAPSSGSSYSSGAVSTDFVPISAVERIEVLKDGASATYGSDALGGVINIITRNDIDGFAFANQYNMSTNNGSDVNRTSLAYGTQSNKSNFMTSLQVTYGQGFRSSDFDYARDLNKSFPFSTNYVNDASGLSPGPNCTELNDSGLCEEAVSPKQVTLPSYQADSVTQYSRQIMADTTFYTTLIAGYGRFQSEFPNVLNTPGDTLGVAFNAAESPTSWNSLPDYSGGDTRVFHRFDDYVNTTTDQSYYGGLVLGTKGYWGDSDWQWDVSANNQISIAESNEDNLATVSGARNAFINNEYNPFDPSVRDTSNLGIDAFNRNTAVVHWVEAKTNGPMGRFLGFDWSNALGTSFAYFAYSDHRAADIVNDNVMLQSGVVGRGSRELYSLFTEFSGLVGKSFELQFSMRGDFYSDFGETFNPKLAARYQPTKWLTFRSSAGTGFQAPTLQDMNAKLRGYSFLVDQTRCKDPGLGNGNPSSSECTSQTVPFFQNNNENLKEETSISVNFGTIIQPTRAFSVSLDWWYVKVEDTIGVDLDDIMRLEEEGTDPAKYGVNVIRQGGSPTGQIQRIDYQLFNVGTEEANGLDLELKYNLKTTIGDWTFINETTYLNHYYEQFYEEFGKQQVLGQFERPRWRNNFTLGWKNGSWLAQTIARSIADVETRVRGFGKIVSPTQFDILLAYDPSWMGSLSLGVRNIGNIRPRFDETFGAKVSGALFQRTETYYMTYRHDF